MFKNVKILITRDTFNRILNFKITFIFKENSLFYSCVEVHRQYDISLHVTLSLTDSDLHWTEKVLNRVCQINFLLVFYVYITVHALYIQL